jgi:LPXTG-motif cell wall-anchored protein
MRKRILAFTIVVLALPTLASAGIIQPPPGPLEVPTLGEYGLLTLGGVLAVGGLVLLVRRRRR